jgi:hypothetical protein
MSKTTDCYLMPWVGLGSHGIVVLQKVECKCRANNLWSRKNVEFGWMRGSRG